MIPVSFDDLLVWEDPRFQLLKSVPQVDAGAIETWVFLKGEFYLWFWKTIFFTGVMVAKTDGKIIA